MKDPTVVNFNHAVHLNPDTDAKREVFKKQLKDLSGRRGIETGSDGSSSFACSYCHVPTEKGAYLAPVHYESHCRDCHPVKSDDRAIPHESPESIRIFLQSLKAKEGATEDDLVDLVMEAEVPLYESDPDGCMKCHVTELGDDFPETAPIVTPTGIRSGPPGFEGKPRHWLPHSKFDHSAHRELRCTECHVGIGESKLTSDFTLPSINVCLSCHSPAGKVKTNCVSCHDFHNPEHGRKPEGSLQIKDLIR